MALTGRCLCGSVNNECDAEPLSVTYCHCEYCRRVTGSAFNVSVAVPTQSLRVTGKVQRYIAPDDVQQERVREFCPVCGSPLFTHHPHGSFTRAGTLDNSENLKPMREMWTERAVPWAHIPDVIKSYPQGAPKIDANK